MSMLQNFSKWVLYRRMKFRTEITQEFPRKYIIALAPHTSNWDFIIGQLFSRAEGFKCDFMMKRQWFFWPMGCLMRRLGGIPVERSRKMSLTDQLAQVANQRSDFALCITPEGTRKAVTEWKRGFYYIALKANLPILLFSVDFKDKLIKCTKTVIPNGDVEAQMREIKEYYRGVQGKNPELFAL